MTRSLEARERLFEAFPEGFRNKHLAAALGVTTARASQLINRWLWDGELKRVGDRRCYVRASSLGSARGAEPHAWWHYLTRDNPSVVYLALAGLGVRHFRTRQQIRSAVGVTKLGQKYLIADFEGIASFSEPALDELLHRIHWKIAVIPINVPFALASAVRRTIAR